MKVNTVIFLCFISFLLYNSQQAVAGIGAITKTKWFSVYDAEGKTNLLPYKGKSGCYIIKENNVVVYVGYSGVNLYKTILRHFQKWSSKYQEVVTYVNDYSRNDYKIRVITCTPKQAERLEKALINKYSPRDNSNNNEAADFTADSYTKDILQKVEETEPAPF